MKITISLFLLVIYCQISRAQQQDRAMEIPPAPEYNSCEKAKLGYGFEDSGMTMYVARPKVFNHQWVNDSTLQFSLFVVYGCCGIDYTNYRINGDTLLLLYGLVENLPLPGYKAGDDRIYSVCDCGGGCCYKLDFEITGIIKKKNYLVKILDVVNLIDFESNAYPVGYTNPKAKSIYFPLGCIDPKLCLEDKIESALYHYGLLKPLYEKLINNGGAKDELRKTWIHFFKDVEAIKSPFLQIKADSMFYENRLAEFESSIEEKRLGMVELFSEGENIIQGIIEEVIIIEKDSLYEESGVLEIVDASAYPTEEMESFMQWVESELNYPKEALKNKIEGKVYVSFIVNKNGSLSEYKVIRGLGFGCDEEALRVLKKSKNWLPAIHNSETVKQRIVLPIKFKL